MRPVGRDLTKEKEEEERTGRIGLAPANYHVLREQNSKQKGQPKAGEQKAEVREERRRGSFFKALTGN